MTELIYVLASVLVVSLISFIGVFTFSLKDSALRKALLYLVSFSAGGLLGDVFIHLLPEAAGKGFTLELSFFVLLGIIVSFVMEKFIQWRHCHVATSEEHPHPLAYMNLVGDSVHNFIDGVIIAGSFIASIPVGIATTIAVIFHEIPQEIGDFGVLIHAGLSKVKALKLNFLTALTSFAGALIVIVFSQFFSFSNYLFYLIPFAAGNFMYIALSDLVPEMHKEVKMEKSFAQLIAFVFGILLMLSLKFLG
ncbi:MAG: ZIP family metal transporter [Candidatus Diapherotrites archaeon]